MLIECGIEPAVLVVADVPGRDRILGAVERDADVEHRTRERVLVEVRIRRVVDDVARRRHVGAQHVDARTDRKLDVVLEKNRRPVGNHVRPLTVKSGK